MYTSIQLQPWDSSRLRLTDLNSDVIVNILTFLRPHHIFSFRQTCRAFSKVTRIRTVWLNALKSMMHAYSITECTFPLSSMSLPALEHAALAPRRFIELLKAQTETGSILLTPTQTRILPSRLTGREQKEHGVSSSGQNDSFRVAPGGRYLIVSSKHSPSGSGYQEAYVFTLWDVGLGHQAETKVVGRMTWAQSDTCWLHDLYFDTRPSGHGVLYFIFSCSSLNTPNKVNVFTITLSGSAPAKFDLQFERVIADNATVVVSRDLNWVVGHYETDDDEQCFLVWNFAEGHGVSWTAPDCTFDHKEIVALYPFKNTLIAGNLGNDVMVYNIPDMESLTTTHCRHLTLNALLVLKNPLSESNSDSNEDKGFYTHNTHNRCEYTLQQPYFCVSSSERVFFYRIKDLTSILDPNIPKNIPLNLGSFPISKDLFSYFQFDFLDNMDDEHLLAGHLNPYWSALSVSVFDLDDNGKPVGADEGDAAMRMRHQSTVLGLTEMTTMHVSSSAGRFFFLTDASMPMVQIFDYLRFPE